MNARRGLNVVYAFILDHGWSDAQADAIADFDAALNGTVTERARTQRLAGVLSAGGEVG